MEVQWRMKRGRYNRRWLDRVSDDIKEKGLSAEEVYDHATWRRMYSVNIQNISYIDRPHIKVGIRLVGGRR